MQSSIHEIKARD